MVFPPVFLICVFLAFIVQQFLPPLPNGARIYLLPLLVFYSAVATPFWMMLAVAFMSGLIWDAYTGQVLSSAASNSMGSADYVEISVGWSIFLYATFGAIMSGFRPVFQRGRWDVYVLVSILCGVFTAMIVAAEFAMICFRRGGFFFTREAGARIVGSGLAAVLMAPALFVLLNMIARACRHEPHPQKRSER